jgi:hypothetical protein
MTPPPAAATKYADQIVQLETSAVRTPQELTTAVETTFVKLEAHLVSLVGTVGFRALLARAIHLTQPDWPWVQNAQVKAKATLFIEPSLDQTLRGEGRARVEAYVVIPGLVALAEQHGLDGVKAGTGILLANVINLLCSFIGNDLTFRLLRRAWPQLADTSSGQE